MSLRAICAVFHVLISIVCCNVSKAEKKIVDVDGRKVLCHNFAGPSATKVKLVIALHGLGSSSNEMVNSTGLLKKARKHKLMLAAPEGRVTRKLGPFEVKGWNAGGCCHERSNNSIDVDFITDLLVKLKSENAAIDLEQLYLIGFSNGAMLAQRLGFQLPLEVEVSTTSGSTKYPVAIKGIASLSGKLAIYDGDLRPRKKPIPLIHFHGTKDGVVDFAGTSVDGGYKNERGDKMLSIWKDRNKATVAQLPVQSINKKPGDGTVVRIERWKPAPSDKGAPVVLVTVENGGHTWPGHAPPAHYKELEALGFASLGLHTKEIKAEDKIFEFFGMN